MSTQLSGMVAYVLTRWECSGGCGTYDQANSLDIAATGTCPKCGLPGMGTNFTCHGMTCRPLPFVTSPKLYDGMDVRFKELRFQRTRTVAGNRWGKRAPASVEVNHPRPNPKAPILPGDPSGKRVR